MARAFPTANKTKREKRTSRRGQCLARARTSAPDPSALRAHFAAEKRARTACHFHRCEAAFQGRDQACGRAATHVPRPRSARTVLGFVCRGERPSPACRGFASSTAIARLFPRETSGRERGRTQKALASRTSTAVFTALHARRELPEENLRACTRQDPVALFSLRRTLPRTLFGERGGIQSVVGEQR